MLVKSINRSLEEMQQIKSSICFSRLTVARPSLLRIASLFIQVIPVCLFLAHDQNYDAIFRSQIRRREKNKKTHSQKVSRRNVKCM